MKPRWHRVALFYGFSLAGISLMGLTLHLLGGAHGGQQILFSALAMLSPLLATILVHKLDGRPAFDGFARLRWSRWFVVASLLPLALALATMLVGPLLPGAAWDWEMHALFENLATSMTPDEMSTLRSEIEGLPVHPVWLALPQAIVAGLTINALFAFGEEVGWRGWLHRELTALGFWQANLVTGVLWGFWHAPLIVVGHNYPDHPIEGIFLFVVVCVLLSAPHAWIRERTGSVWGAAVFHGTFNAAASISALVVMGSDLVVGAPGLAGVLVLLCLNLALWMAGVGRTRDMSSHAASRSASRQRAC